MRILLSCASLLPSYGGPAFSVSQLALALARQGAAVGVWTADQSVVETSVLPPEAPVRRLLGSETEALRGFGLVEVLHDNGIWLPHNHRWAKLARARGIPRIVSIRGMLEPWALNHKRFKKSIAWKLYQRRDLSLADAHHATSAREAENIRKFHLGASVHMIPNGVAIPVREEGANGKAHDRNGSEDRVALFLGRLYPVKGLAELIEAWSRVRPAGWRLKIAGPDEAGYLAKLEKAVAAARVRDSISFLGPLTGDAKTAAFLGADLFVLPSHSESFGMAIGEALAHGLPVLTTTAVPWPMLSAEQCGWTVAPTVEGLIEGLHDVTSRDRAELKAMGMKGRAFVAERLSWDIVAKQFVTMYESMSTSRRLLYAT